MNIKYILGTIIAIPLLPLLYFQGRRIKKRVPRLPVATGETGLCSSSSENTLRMLTIGESTIAGVGVKTHQEGLTGVLANELATRLNIKVDRKVYAKSGITAKRVNDNIINLIEEKHIDLIVIGLGGNDAFELNTPRKWKKDVRQLINNIKVKFKEVTIVFINMPPIKEFPAFTSLIQFTIGNLAEILGEELKRVVKDFESVYYCSSRVGYKDLIKRFNLTLEASDFYCDGVHPSKVTYQYWAKDVACFMIHSKGITKKLI